MVGHRSNSKPNLPRAEHFSERADTVAGLPASAIKGVVKSVADKKRWQAPVATFKQWQTEYEKEYQSLLWLCCTMDGARAIVRRHLTCAVCISIEANIQQQATGSWARA